MPLALIKKLYFSPVKSLSFSYSRNLKIKKNIGIKNDRVFAFTRIINKATSLTYEAHPKKRNLNFFMALKNSPFLNKYNFMLNNNYLSFLFGKKIIKEISIKNRNDFKMIVTELMFLEKKIKKKPYLICNFDCPFFDTMPKNSVSLINMNTIEHFEKKATFQIDHRRFRGNIYVNNLKPWSEFKWINKHISINGCLFKVIGKIPRCSATSLIPDSDFANINLPEKLINIYGHRDFGIYLYPLTDGLINVGNTIGR